MASKIQRVDLHKEVSPSGSPIVVPHLVSQIPNATQSLVRVNSELVLRKDDEFQCGHVPKIGPFVTPPPSGSGRGRITNAGQNFVCIRKIAVATMAGRNSSCTEGVSELPNNSSVKNQHKSFISINGQPVLLG